MYYKKSLWNLQGYEKSSRKGKMYNALIKHRNNGKIVRIPFGSTDYENYRDKTDLNLYPKLIHNDKNRRSRYRKRMKHSVRGEYYSPSWFSYNILW